MIALSPRILTRLRATLACCRQFDNDRALQALFDNDERINPWADELQTAHCISSRVDFVIALLRDRESGIYHENALVLLLQVVRDTVHPHDTLHAELAALAADLKGGATASSARPATTSPEREDVNPQLARARKVLHHLEMQAAGFGALHVPAHLQIELEEQREKVAALEAQLR